MTSKLSILLTIILVFGEWEAVSRKYGCSIIDHSVGTLVLEFTGTPEEIDALLDDCKEFGILELCRTGVTALERGKTSYTLE